MVWFRTSHRERTCARRSPVLLRSPANPQVIQLLYRLFAMCIIPLVLSIAFDLTLTLTLPLTLAVALVFHSRDSGPGPASLC